MCACVGVVVSNINHVAARTSKSVMLAVVRRVINVGCLRAPERVDANKIINLSNLIFYEIDREREREGEEAIFLVRNKQSRIYILTSPKTEIIVSQTESVGRAKENNLFDRKIL